MTDRPLTTKQKGYLEGILQGLSGVKACKQAGYKGNTNTLGQRAHELVKHSKIKKALAKRKAEIEAKTDYSIEQWRTDVRAARTLANDAKNYSAVAAFDRLLGQHLGVFELDNKQKVEIRQLTEVDIGIAKLIASHYILDSLKALPREAESVPEPTQEGQANV